MMNGCIMTNRRVGDAMVRWLWARSRRGVPALLVGMLAMGWPVHAWSATTQPAEREPAENASSERVDEQEMAELLEEPAARGRRGGQSESTYKQVGDPMYGGTLVFVHPRGAVTEQDGKLLFHPLGEPLNSGRELSAEEEPIVYHELLKLKEKARGISERPG